MNQRIVFLSHPISGDPEGNVKKLLAIIRHINLTELDVVPFCPYIGDVMALNEHVPEERQIGLDNGLRLIRKIHIYIDECRMYGDTVSPGMLAEKQLFESLGVPVVDMTGVEVIPVCKHCDGTGKIVVTHGFYKNSCVCKWCEGTGHYTLVAR